MWYREQKVEAKLGRGLDSLSLIFQHTNQFCDFEFSQGVEPLEPFFVKVATTAASTPTSLAAATVSS